MFENTNNTNYSFIPFNMAPCFPVDMYGVVFVRSLFVCFFFFFFFLFFQRFNCRIQKARNKDKGHDFLNRTDVV